MMTRRSLILASTLCAFASAAAAQAAPELGDYASNAAGCASVKYDLTLTETGAVFPAFACEALTLQPAEATDGKPTFQAASPLCYSSASNRPVAKSFWLVVDQNRLQVLWPDGAHSPWLTRCDKK